jgi:uncharacterized protein YndB with AHSA1/START domain
MATVSVTRVIPAPPDTVWRVFTDLPGRVSWLSEVESVELLDPAGLRVGARWRETRVDAQGTAVTAELVVTELEPGRCLTMSLVGAGDFSRMSYRFEPAVGGDAGGTCVTAVVANHPAGLANRLLAFFLGSFAARTAEGHLRDELDELADACLDAEATTA